MNRRDWLRAAAMVAAGVVVGVKAEPELPLMPWELKLSP